jgi:hypothetical protein
MDVKRQFARQVAECREADIELFRRDGREQFLARHLHDVGHLGRLHVIGAGLFRLADQRRRRIEIDRGIAA